MAIAKIRITDDGGPIVGRLALLLPAEPFAVLKIGDVEISINGTGDMAAERCRMLAGECERLRLDLINADRKPYDAAALLAGAAALAAGAEIEHLGEDVFASFDSATLNVSLSTRAGARIVLTPDVLDALGRFAQREVYKRQRQPLDARAHPGDGDGAAREAGVTLGEATGPTLPTSTPNVFDCGCSRHKVAAGLCDVYDEHGAPRAGRQS